MHRAKPRPPASPPSKKLSPAPDRTDDPGHAILDAFRRIVRVLRESSRAAEEHAGVTGAQLFVLQTLAAAGPSLSINELAERTRTHQSTVSVVVRRLVEHRLVTRRASLEDGRRVEILLTLRGRALLRRAPHLAQERLLDGIERLAPRHRAHLAVSLSALVSTMSLGDEPAGMFFEDEETVARTVQRRSRRGA